jgi:hypothetical protein
MDDPAELLRIYTFAVSKALSNRNLISYLQTKRIVVGTTQSNNPISLGMFYNKSIHILFLLFIEITLKNLHNPIIRRCSCNGTSRYS